MEKEPRKLVLRPSESCSYCHGSGTVYDTVPWGSTTAQMPSTCECVHDSAPADATDEEMDNAEIDTSAADDWRYDYDED